VTYFFNGSRRCRFPGEDRGDGSVGEVGDLAPEAEMSANELTDEAGCAGCPGDTYDSSC